MIIVQYWFQGSHLENRLFTITNQTTTFHGGTRKAIGEEEATHFVAQEPLESPSKSKTTDQTTTMVNAKVYIMKKAQRWLHGSHFGPKIPDYHANYITTSTFHGGYRQ